MEIAAEAAREAPQSAGGIALRVCDLKKNFGPRTALAGVSLQLRIGEILGLLGPNGAGKTTLLRAIMGRVVPDSGSIFILNAAPEGWRHAELGWVTQELALYLRLSAYENLSVFGRYQGLSGKALDRTIRRALEWAALADRAAEPVQNFSGGMKRRLNMAAGIIHDPRILLLDEPTVGVDPQSRERIYGMIEELRRQQVSIIYTTHYMEEAERLCDRISIIDHGHIIAEGTRDQLVRSTLGEMREIILHSDDEIPAAVQGALGAAGLSVDASSVHASVADVAAETATFVGSASPARCGRSGHEGESAESGKRVPPPYRKGTARMIFSVFRTSVLNLRRDRAALGLSFLLPLVFFSIFAGIFAPRMRGGMPKVGLIVVDQDESANSRRFLQALKSERSLDVRLSSKSGVSYDAVSAEAAVRNGGTSVALIIPRGFGDAPLVFGDAKHPKLRLLADTSDPIAPQIVGGMLQKLAMTSMPDVMARQGGEYVEKWAGGLTAEQRRRWDQSLEGFRQSLGQGSGSSATGEGLLAIETRDILGQNKSNPVVAFYAAAVGVMFLLFSAANAGGSLLEEHESGTLDRILSSRVTMGTLMFGKLTYLVVLAVSQLVVMFTWGALVFGVELAGHVIGFLVMALATALAVSSFGLLLASTCRTRAQLGALSALVILTMSALGGSMFPRFLMPESVQKAGLVLFNAWALDGFTKVFWRDASVWALWPQVLALLMFAAVFLSVARRLARRWEHT